MKLFVGLLVMCKVFADSMSDELYAFDDIIGYEKARSLLIEEDRDRYLGNDINLSDAEVIANEMIMRMKYDEIDEAFEHPEVFDLSKHYYNFKKTIESSHLYKVIKKMPKAAILHIHELGMLGADYLLKLTYSDNLYMCDDGNFPILQFFEEPPKQVDPCEWISLKDMRSDSENITEFDEELRQHLTMVVKDPQLVDTDLKVVWDRFQNIFFTVGPMLSYRPVWEQYIYDSLKAFRDDGALYVEIRTLLPIIYELNGTSYDEIFTAQLMYKAVEKFVSDYPDFIGAKMIYAPMRTGPVSDLTNFLETAKKLKSSLPNFFAGFDLVGQEDIGKPLKDYLPDLIEAGDYMDFYFHAGETNWWGTTADYNLIDAILLGTKRLGHAYALVKHPRWMEEVKRRNIAIEVNVISNQVLKLVGDVRNHPLAVMLSQDMPVVISSDDPGLWDAAPLSDDYYVAFVGVSGRHGDLRMLKKLAINSISFSSLTGSEKYDALYRFDQQWTKFINNLVFIDRPDVKFLKNDRD